jgi:hypothetical protein
LKPNKGKFRYTPLGGRGTRDSFFILQFFGKLAIKVLGYYDY